MKGLGFDILAAALALALSNALLAYAAGVNWNCQGNHNCASTTCESYPPEGKSCAEITPVNHPKCEYTGNRSHTCTITQRACLKKDFYAGGLCEGAPPVCNHAFPYNTPVYYCEDGCGTETHTCAT